MRKLAVALTFVAVLALQTAGNAGADAAATSVVGVVAVANGQPVNGYHVMNRQASVLCLVDPWSKALRRFASSLGVLANPGQDPASVIDRSSPAWTVDVGQLGPPLTPLGFLTRHTVKTAWFAAA